MGYWYILILIQRNLCFCGTFDLLFWEYGHIGDMFLHIYIYIFFFLKVWFCISLLTLNCMGIYRVYSQADEQIAAK